MDHELREFFHLMKHASKVNANAHQIATALAKEAGVRKVIPIKQWGAAFSHGTWPYYPEEEDRGSMVIGVPTLDAPNDCCLSTIAHECGHLATVPDKAPPSGIFGLTPPELVSRELEATLWGLNGIVRHGGIVTPEMVRYQQIALNTYVRSSNGHLTPNVLDFLEKGWVHV